MPRLIVHRYNNLPPSYVRGALRPPVKAEGIQPVDVFPDYGPEGMPILPTHPGQRNKMNILWKGSKLQGPHSRASRNTNTQPALPLPPGHIPKSEWDEAMHDIRPQSTGTYQPELPLVSGEKGLHPDQPPEIQPKHRIVGVDY